MGVNLKDMSRVREFTEFGVCVCVGGKLKGNL